MSKLRISEYVVDHGANHVNRRQRRINAKNERVKQHAEKLYKRIHGKVSKAKVVCSGSPMDVQSIRMRKKHGRNAGLPKRKLIIASLNESTRKILRRLVIKDD